MIAILLRRTIRGHLLRSRLENTLTVFQQIRFRFFRTCGLASDHGSFASQRRDDSDRLLVTVIIRANSRRISATAWGTLSESRPWRGLGTHFSP